MPATPRARTTTSPRPTGDRPGHRGRPAADPRPSPARDRCGPPRAVAGPPALQARAPELFGQFAAAVARRYGPRRRPLRRLERAQPAAVAAAAEHLHGAALLPRPSRRIFTARSSAPPSRGRRADPEAPILFGALASRGAGPPQPDSPAPAAGLPACVRLRRRRASSRSARAAARASSRRGATASPFTRTPSTTAPDPRSRTRRGQRSAPCPDSRARSTPPSARAGCTTGGAARTSPLYLDGVRLPDASAGPGSRGSPLAPQSRWLQRATYRPGATRACAC